MTLNQIARIIDHTNINPKATAKDIKKTCQCFNWHPKHSIEQGLKKTILWFRNNLSLYEE